VLSLTNTAFGTDSLYARILQVDAYAGFNDTYNANDPKPFHWKADPVAIITARNRRFQT
jgi:hypothetical protein